MPTLLPITAEWRILLLLLLLLRRLTEGRPVLARKRRSRPERAGARTRTSGTAESARWLLAEPAEPSAKHALSEGVRRACHLRRQALLLPLLASLARLDKRRPRPLTRQPSSTTHPAERRR